MAIKKPKKTPAEKPTSQFRLSINGWNLIGAKYATGWAWVSAECPSLCREFNGCEDPAPVVERFTRLALAAMPSTGA